MSLPVALVTGAAKRIGQAIALDLAAQGYAIALHCHHSVAEAEATAKTIRSGGGKAIILQADLSQETETQTILPAAMAALGPVSVLINNASVFDRDDALTTTRDSWDSHIETNLRAPFVLTQALARYLPSDQHGVVINLLDQRVWSLTPYFTSYTVSKAGLWALTQSLALALAPRIRVAGIGPGPALPSPRQTPEHFAAQVAALPLQQGTSPEEICRAVRFILETPSFTGQMIALDGGQHLGWAMEARGIVVPE